jgi:hypothetical protein
MKVGDTIEGVRNARYAARRQCAAGDDPARFAQGTLESTRQTRWINDLNDVVI